jgi:flavodoxin I
MNVCIVYGSTTGTTERVAGKIATHFDVAEVVAAQKADGSLSCDLLVLGASTWGMGELQEDMAGFLNKFRYGAVDAKFAAIFGLGSQTGFPDSFVDGIADMAAFIEAKQIRNVGIWTPKDIDFASSRATLTDGDLMGLALDEDNQPEKTDLRILGWVEQIKMRLKDAK